MGQNGPKWVKIWQSGQNYSKSSLFRFGLCYVPTYVSEIIQKVAGMVLSYKLLQNTSLYKIPNYDKNSQIALI